MNDFFEKIIDVLNRLHISYMLSGSVAMSLYVLPRATRDFDFIINLQMKDVDSFVENFKEGYYCDKDATIDALSTAGIFNIIDHASGFKADFVVLKDIPFRRTEFNRRLQLDYFGRIIYVVTAEDLIISKIIWIQDYQSAIQIEDVKNLISLNNLDWQYIRYWVNDLKLNTFNLITL